MSAAIPDAAARARALDAGRSFIVQAPAGSGKTELLIQRYLALLARVERPEEIAAITFTRKAAAQMRSRILEALEAARASPRPEEPHRRATWDLARKALERDAALGWKLAESAPRLRVQTIDAVCASLTRQMPVLSRFGAQPESIDDASAHYAEAARNTLAALEDPDDASATDMARLLSHLDNDAAIAEALLAALLRRRDHWLGAVGAPPDRAGLEATLERLRVATVRRAQALFPPLPGLEPLPPVDDVEAWKALCRALLTKEGDWRSKSKHPYHPSIRDDDALCEALRAVQLLPPGGYGESQWAALGSILRLLPRAVAELKLVFASRGQADFVEIAQAALRALHTDEGPTDLMLALDYRIGHLLVDEFQDTSFTQSTLLRFLTAEWTPGDGRTLFVVGDPMQSIYRFREAEVALFLRAQHEGIGSVALEPLRLTANFRSQAGIVKWVNETFAAVMPPVEDVAAGAVRYSPSEAIHAPRPEAVTVHPFFDGDGAGQARRVVELARAAMAAPADGGRPHTAAILVRNRSHLAEIVPRLRAAGLAFRAIEIEPLAHRPVVQDLLALTRALSHLADRVAWLAVLRAPWAGLTLVDLQAVAGDPMGTVWESITDPACVMGLSDAGRERLEPVREVLGAALARRARGSLRDAVEAAWLALGGPACVPGATDLEDAEAFLAHLEKSEDAGALPSLADFEASLAKLHALPDVEASERLQVMTIHKAKGLEFDTVIVPGLGAGTAHDERRLFMWMQTTEGLLLAPINPAGSDKDPLYEFIRRLDQEKAEHECGRLLYVAATRARSRLHLLGDCKRHADGTCRAPAKGSLLAKLWPAVGRQFENAPPAAIRAPIDAAPAPRGDELVRLASPVVMDPPEALSWFAPPQPARLREAIEFSWVGETARRVGTVVHRWLQRIADDELRGWDAPRIAAARPAILNELAARGIAPAEMEAAADRVITSLSACMDDPRGRWVLGPQRDARNEYRISAIVAGQRRQLVIDRMFVDAQGRSWVVDYKTSSHEGADVEGFLADEQQRYREQLERYASVAVRGEAMLGLYFPLLRGWREWPSARPAPVDAALTE